MKRHAAVLLSVLFAVSAFGADLSRFRNWNSSPQGLFMTAAERTAWKDVATDEQAEAFVTAFLARRAPGFPAQVAERAAMADKYLTIGNVKGSTTFRGRLIILFGPPSNIQVNDRQGKKSFVPPPSTAAVTDLGGGATASSSTGETQKIGTARPGEAFRDFVFTFPSTVSPSFGKKDLVVEVEADAGTGTDRLKDPKKSDALDAMFEAVATASIVK